MRSVSASTSAASVIGEIAIARQRLRGPDGADPACAAPLGPDDDTLEMCAAAYALPDGFREKSRLGIPLAWAWPSSTFDSTLSRRDELIQAAAMLTAAVERLDRHNEMALAPARRQLQVVTAVGQK